MKVKIGKYPSCLSVGILSKYMCKKYGVLWPNENERTPFEKMLEKIDDFLQEYFCDPLNQLFFHDRNQKVKVHIDHWDTWSMDYTLTHIILPMLKQLKETKHGAPYVENVDVPEELQMTVHEKLAWKVDGETNDKWHDRWNWVLGEMIHAFEQKCADDWREQFFIEDSSAECGLRMDSEGIEKEQERISNGFRLFGKYFENLWD